MEPLTEAQEKVWKALSSFQRDRGYIPSFRELAKSCGFKSLNTVHFHLKRLKRKGYIKYPAYRSRLIVPAISFRSIPVFGTVPAGDPSLALEEHDEYIEVDPAMVKGPSFALRVKGDSMKDAGILPGDVVVVRRQNAAKNGDIVVARFEDEATIKYLKNTRNDTYLVPANEKYKPIPAREAELVGVVTGVIRRYG